jgi:flagellar capping protein FliD
MNQDLDVGNEYYLIDVQMFVTTSLHMFCQFCHVSDLSHFFIHLSLPVYTQSSLSHFCIHLSLPVYTQFSFEAQFSNQQSEALTSLRTAVAAAEKTSSVQIKELETKVLGLQQQLSNREKQSESQLLQLRTTVAELRDQLSAAQTTKMKVILNIISG